MELLPVFSTGLLARVVCTLPCSVLRHPGLETNAVGNLFFAGENCRAHFQGFMNGAAETRRMAVDEVVKAAKRKRVVLMEGVGTN